MFLSPPKQITIKGENKASENHLSVINASTHSPCQQVSTTGCRKRDIVSTNPQSTNVYWFQMWFAVYLIPVENISTEPALRQTEFARRSITHQACLPCHTLERNFRNSARFLDSWGGNETIDSASSRAKSTGVTLQTCDVRHDTFHSDYKHQYWTSQAWLLSGCRSELGVGVRLTQHAGREHRALCCLTPVNASICSNVWASTCRVLLWSEEATEARLLQRDSQVSSHTWGIKDFYSEDGKGETRTEQIICDAATPRLLAVKLLR